MSMEKEIRAVFAEVRADVRRAAVAAVNDSAFDVRSGVHAEMAKRLDRPTAFALRSMSVRKATLSRPEAEIFLDNWSSKGNSPERAFAHLFTDHASQHRRWKKYEAALLKARVLPAGMAAVPPRAESWAVRLDAHGNVPGSTIVMLLSYFRAFGEQGYRANATDRSRARRAKVSRKSGYAEINGVVYFVVRREDRRHVNLAPGIWAKKGIHGVQVAPVLLFVRKPRYAALLDLESIARREIDRGFERHLSYHLSRRLGK